MIRSPGISYLFGVLVRILILANVIDPAVSLDALLEAFGLIDRVDDERERDPIARDESPEERFQRGLVLIA